MNEQRLYECGHMHTYSGCLGADVDERDQLRAERDAYAAALRGIVDAYYEFEGEGDQTLAAVLSERIDAAAVLSGQPQQGDA